jgi:hypothetical protein
MLVNQARAAAVQLLRFRRSLESQPQIVLVQHSTFNVSTPVVKRARSWIHSPCALAHLINHLPMICLHSTLPYALCVRSYAKEFTGTEHGAAERERLRLCNHKSSPRSRQAIEEEQVILTFGGVASFVINRCTCEHDSLSAQL